MSKRRGHAVTEGKNKGKKSKKNAEEENNENEEETFVSEDVLLLSGDDDEETTKFSKFTKKCIDAGKARIKSLKELLKNKTNLVIQLLKFKFQGIDPTMMDPGANIRPLNESGFKKLKRNIENIGWLPSSHIVVCKSINYDQTGRVRIVDGYHRWRVIMDFKGSQDATIRDEWKDFLMPCVVLDWMDHRLEISLAYGIFFILLFQFKMNQTIITLRCS